MVIARQTGTSFKNKSYGEDQVRANKRATKEMLCLTSFQLKMNLFSCLTKVSPRTICHILLDGLGDALQGSTEQTLLDF